MSKVIRACIALAAFAAFMVVPSVASAQNLATVTDEGKSLVVSHAEPAKILGTHNGTNLRMTDTAGNTLVLCETAEIHGTLETNTGHVVEGTVDAAKFVKHNQTHCESSFGGITVETNPPTNGLPWCLRSTSTMATDEFQVRGNGCTSAERPIRFVLNSTTIGACTYERTTPVVGTYTTGGTQATLSITKQEFKRVAGSFLCPTHGLLDLTFTLETTDTGVPLTIFNGT